MIKVEDKNKTLAFIKRHPILFNLMLMFLVGCGVVWMTLIGLDVWTEHGKFEIVPNMRGLSYSQAASALTAAGLQPELSDSIYDDTTAPGTVLEQSPRANTKVKPNRVVYLTINAFSPKMVSVPSLADMSLRQARSTLEGIGIKKIKEHYVPSEYRDLVIGAKFNGITLKPGARIPTSATVTIEVGGGLPDEEDSVAVAEAVSTGLESAELNID